jgi:hypothetical protein
MIQEETEADLKRVRNQPIPYIQPIKPRQEPTQKPNIYEIPVNDRYRVHPLSLLSLSLSLSHPQFCILPRLSFN